MFMVLSETASESLLFTKLMFVKSQLLHVKLTFIRVKPRLKHTVASSAPSYRPLVAFYKIHTPI